MKASSLTVEKLLAAKTELENALRETERILEVVPSRVQEFSVMGFKVQANPLLDTNMGYIVNGKRELLGWVLFDKGKLLMFTEEALEQHRQLGKLKIKERP
jgi:hypothetical protein